MTADTIEKLLGALAESELRERSTSLYLERALEEADLLARFLVAIGINHHVVLDRYWIDSASKLISARFSPDVALLDGLAEDTRSSILTTCKRLLNNADDVDAALS